MRPGSHAEYFATAAPEAIRGPKGNLSFALDQPLPLELIGRVADALHRQYSSRT